MALQTSVKRGQIAVGKARREGWTVEASSIPELAAMQFCRITPFRQTSKDLLHTRRCAIDVAAAVRAMAFWLWMAINGVPQQ